MEPRRSHERSGQPDFPFDAETVIEMSSPATATVKTFNATLVEDVSAYQKEWLGFMKQRWLENAALPQRLASCRSLPEVQQVYTDYWRRAADQYGAEWRHLTEISQSRPVHAAEVEFAPTARETPNVNPLSI